jgi:DNA helicase-2/ATP-dependent DNA helicase PcrA
LALTREQCDVLQHPEGHAIVGAVAGSGKSTTMRHRIVCLLERGVDAQAILVLMFNKDAQEDFSSKLWRLLGPRADSVCVQTFHAYGRAVLEKFVNEQLLPPAKLLTQDWEVAVLGREALTRANPLVEESERVDVDAEVIDAFLRLVDLMKSNLLTPADLDLPVPGKVFRLALKHFEELREERGLRTFADLIYDPMRLMAGRHADAERARSLVRNRFQHLILDEYQDINEAQQALVRILAGTRAAVMAVGDEDQCIYAWRGANPEYMCERFEEDFPGARRYTLPHTFRFGHQIAIAVNHLLAHNRERTDKLCLAAARTPWTSYDLRLYRSSEGSGAVVLEAVDHWLARGRKARDIAILVREYASTLPVEVALLAAGRPYRLVGADPALDRRELKAMRGYLLLAARGFSALEGEDRQAVFEAMLQTPTMFLRAEAREALANAMAQDPDHATAVLRAAAERAGRAGGQTLSKAYDQWGQIAALGPEAAAAPTVDKIREILELDAYIERHHVNRDTQRDKKAMLDQYFLFAEQLAMPVAEFVVRVQELMATIREGTEDAILLTSVHRAKGLEWPHVILPELGDGTFPAFSGRDPSPELLEEERRLFHVAMTRAREVLTLAAPFDRGLLQSMQERKGFVPDQGRMWASRFLYELNLKLAREMGTALNRQQSVRVGYTALPTAVAERYLAGLQQGTTNQAAVKLPGSEPIRRPTTTSDSPFARPPF